MKKLFFFLFVSFLMIQSCKKEEENATNYAVLSETDLSEITSGATSLSAAVQDVMFTHISVAADSGMYISYPDMSGKKSTRPDNGVKKTSAGWSGPDANGWYTNHWEGTYNYTERVRCCDTIVEYEYTISYDGADGSYESKNSTQYTRYTRNGKTYYKGFWDWTVSNSGYNDISEVHWKMAFNDWNPLTGAGDFDWSWGANSNGGNDVPFYRYLNVLATDAGNEWLHVKITFYDGNTESWSFDYDTPWSPVEMPELHTCSVN
jgi:hypothetical protein